MTNLSRLQIQGAVVQVREFLKPLTRDYSRMYSVRGILTEQFGYTQEQADEIVRYIADEGFSYCLDPKVSSGGVEGRKEYPHRDVCYWNPDQLYSRMCCVSVGREIPRSVAA